MVGIGPTEFVILLAFLCIMFCKWLFGGPGPFVPGFGTVPVDELPPPCDPNSKPTAHDRRW